MKSQVTLTTLAKMKENGEKIVALTAYDYSFASMVDSSGVHMILVGDSLGMVVQGESSTLPVTMDEMIYHTKIVTKACKNALVVGDMPFLSYHGSTDEAVQNAGRFLKEAGAGAIKLEGGAAVCDAISAISSAGIPVQAHIGLRPQAVHQMGGYKVQRNEELLMKDALDVQAAGAFSVVLEGIPADIAAKITKELKISTIGIGAGPECDGQILVMHDMLGLNTGHIPKFVKQYRKLSEEVKGGIEEYVKEVQSGAFPAKEHCY